MSPIVRIIVNPISGRRGAQPLLRSLIRALNRRALEVEVCRTTGPGDAARLAAVEAERYRAVLVVGGDGTVREAVGGMEGRAAPLAICPTGTENLAAKYFGFRADPEQLASAIEAGNTRRIDLGRFNGAPFLCVAGFGFDAEVVRRLARERTGHISYESYLRPLWRTFGGHRFPLLHVEADGERVCDARGMAYVGNIPRYAWGLRLLKQAAPDDGKLDLCVFRCEGRGRLLLHACRTVMGTHLMSPGVLYRQARHIRVWTDQAVPFEVDGDDAGDVGPSRKACDGRTLRAPTTASVAFTVAPAALRVIVPPGG